MFTSLATKFYKGAVTVQWANSIKENDSWLFDFMAVKAWGNFNGDPSALTARLSYNVASFTNFSAGKYVVGFTTHFTTNTYCVVGCSNTRFNPTGTGQFGDADAFGPVTFSSGSFEFRVESDDGVPRDNDSIHFMAIGPYTS